MSGQKPQVANLERFVIGTRVKPDESLMSFIVRLAGRLGLKNSRILAQAKIFTKDGASSDELKRLANFADVEHGELVAIATGVRNGRTLNYRGVAINEWFFPRTRLERKICPECLSESLHHRATWDLGFFTHCPIHQRELITNCPRCRSTLTWSCRHLGWCQCGRCDLTAIPKPDVEMDRKVLDAIAVTAGLLGDELFASNAAGAMRLAPLADMEPVHAADFLARFSSMLEVGYDGKFDILAIRRTPVPLIAGLAELEKWPSSFMDPNYMQRFNKGHPVERTQTLVTFHDAVVTWLNEIPASQGKVVRDLVALDPFNLRDVPPSRNRSRLSPDTQIKG